MKGNLRRRSSVARSIRRSQSGPAGITFEQQLLASLQGNVDATKEEIIEKIVSLSLKATLKSLQQENEQIEICTSQTIDDTQGDLIDHLVNNLSRQPLLAEEGSKTLATQIHDFCNSETTVKTQNLVTESKNTPIVSARLRTLEQYQSSLDKEINEWDELLQQRKNKYNFARLEYQEVCRGEQRITDKHRSQLPRLEDAWLRGLSDGRAELNRLEQQEVMMELCEKQMREKMARKRKLLQDTTAELDQIAKNVCDTAANNLNEFESYINEKPFKLTNKADVQSSDRDNSKSDFAKEVNDWFEEMQKT